MNEYSGEVQPSFHPSIDVLTLCKLGMFTGAFLMSFPSAATKNTALQRYLSPISMFPKLFHYPYNEYFRPSDRVREKKNIVRVLGGKLGSEKRQLCGTPQSCEQSNISIYTITRPPKKNLTGKKFWINEKDNYCFLTLAINVNQHSPFCDYFGQS